MHATVHLVTDNPEMSYEDINRIMDPYYEENIYKYDPERDEYTEPEIMPQFSWDYFTVSNPPFFEKAEDCFILIGPDGQAIAREWWNGEEHIDQRKTFDDFCKVNFPKWRGWKMKMAELDIF